MRCFTILIHLQNPARVCVYRTSHFGRSHFECLGRLRLRAPALDPAAPCFPRRAHPMQDQAGWARRGHGAERGTPAGAGVSRSKDLAEKATFEPALEDKEGAGEGSARGVSSQQREGLGGTGKGGRNREGSAAHVARCSGSIYFLFLMLPLPPKVVEIYIWYIYMKIIYIYIYICMCHLTNSDNYHISWFHKSIALKA